MNEYNRLIKVELFLGWFWFFLFVVFTFIFNSVFKNNFNIMHIMPLGYLLVSVYSFWKAYKELKRRRELIDFGVVSRVRVLRTMGGTLKVNKTRYKDIYFMFKDKEMVMWNQDPTEIEKSKTEGYITIKYDLKDIGNLILWY